MHKAERIINSGQARDGADVQTELFPDVSKRTVRRRLAKHGLHGHIRAEKLLLTPKHKKGRRTLVRVFAGWEEENWDTVIFSDELKFNLFGSDGKIYCRRRAGHCY